MLVICIEGCHGSGKTALCEAFQNLGISVLDEVRIQYNDSHLEFFRGMYENIL